MRSLVTDLLLVMLITFQMCAVSGDGNKRIIRESAPQPEKALLRSVNRILVHLQVKDEFNDARDAIDSLYILESKEWTVRKMRKVFVGFERGLAARKNAASSNPLDIKAAITEKDAANAECALTTLCEALSHKKGCNVKFLEGNIKTHVDRSSKPELIFDGLLKTTKVMINRLGML